MNSTKRNARIAGLLYLLLALTGAFSLLYVPTQLIVFGDAAATADNIRSSEWLFRIGIFSGLVSNVLFVFLVLALYRLFKEVNHRQAVLMVILVVISVSTSFVNTFNDLAVLILLSGADFLGVFEEHKLEAAAYGFIRLQSHAIQVIQIFWGLWLFPFGILVYRSNFIPKILGFLLILAGVGYVLRSFMFLVLPQYQDALSLLITILETAELPIIFWLLIMGATVRSEEQQGTETRRPQ